jgi:dipeptidyl aminopeptidase/acylaminoacyl peptidase
VHGFVAEPQGSGPHPTVLLIHGGPHWLWDDSWRPETAAWVDHGFAVAMVNYRGSTGYGRAWRDSILGDPGFPEVEDELAGLDSLIESGVTDPERVVVSGGSWGGYLTLLSIGRHPGRWAAAIAIVPVADYPTAYADEAPGLKAFDRVLFGGTPDDRRELYLERSPLTYVDRVDVPLLVIAGDNDTRCPIRQVENYLRRLDELGLEYRVHRFDAGHGSLVIDERVTQMKMELDFVLPLLTDE